MNASYCLRNKTEFETTTMAEKGIQSKKVNVFYSLNLDYRYIVTDELEVSIFLKENHIKFGSVLNLDNTSLGKYQNGKFNKINTRNLAGLNYDFKVQPDNLRLIKLEKGIETK